MAETPCRATEKPFHSDSHAGDESTGGDLTRHQWTSPCLFWDLSFLSAQPFGTCDSLWLWHGFPQHCHPCRLIILAHSLLTIVVSPAREHCSDGDPLTLQGSAKLPSSQTHHGGKRQQAAERTTRANFKKKQLLGKRRTHCFSVLPASQPLHKCCCTKCPQDLRKGQQEQSHSLCPHNMCFNLPRHTGGLVHCPSVQVIYWDPSRT